jgi:hypothetical protein
MKLEELLNVLPANAYIMVKEGSSPETGTVLVDIEILNRIRRKYPALLARTVAFLWHEEPGAGFGRYVIGIEE